MKPGNWPWKAKSPLFCRRKGWILKVSIRISFLIEALRNVCGCLDEKLHKWKREEEKMKEISKGDVFTLPAKNVTQEMINRYADAAEDHNPLHIAYIWQGLADQRGNRNELYGTGISGRHDYNGSQSHEGCTG